MADARPQRETQDVDGEVYRVRTIEVFVNFSTPMVDGCGCFNRPILSGSLETVRTMERLGTNR